jgi:hypothetical protein
MKSSSLLRFVASAALAVLFCAALLHAQAKPITFKGLLTSLNTHGLSNAELAQIVKSRGVDFELTPEMESELKAAGADANLIAAVRSSYRGTTSASDVPPSSEPPAAQPPASSPPPEKTKAGGTATGPVIASIRDVKKIFIEKMPNDLDEFIKDELSRQIPNRFLIVTRQEDADAVMRGTATTHKGSITITDLHGTVELWAGEAGDKGIFITKIHGGEKKIAERLVSDLKKALQ